MLALLVVLVIPLPVLASDGQPLQPACPRSGCQAAPVSAQRWAVPLAGSWSAGGVASEGTVPAAGQAYVAVGGEVAVLGTGLQLTGYALASGRQQWQTTLSAPAGTAIMSVRAWPGAVTVGLLAPDASSRTEVVLDAGDGAVLRRYPAAIFGGAVAATAATTVVISSGAVTSYDNATGRVRWRHSVSGVQSWQADGATLYVAQSPGGYLSSSPVSALKVINLATGAERMLTPPLGSPFSGKLALAADGAVLFASTAGVAAYSGSSGAELWATAGAVPEGSDPDTGLVYLSSAAGTLSAVNPLDGVVQASVASAAVPGSAGLYVVRDGTALGLDLGANGQAFGYNLAARRVTWTPVALPWPHFFSDVSGLGGSAALSGAAVVVTACPHLAPSSAACADPELVAFNW